jgi:SAM-dependent methyltransferase
VTGLASAAADIFGQGLGEPYARALRTGRGRLTLRALDDGRTGSACAGREVTYDVLSWCSEASPMERQLLQNVNGPLLDIGCGPGRMLSAARAAGLAAVGIDTSHEAVSRALDRGAHALHQTVFAAVPHPRHWQSILLLDGNIGIGGNIPALLGRCRQLIADSGTLLVELEQEDDVDTDYLAVLEDSDGNCSEPFPWARIGLSGLEPRARAAGWTVTLSQRLQGRVICRLSPVPVPARSTL